MKSVIKIRNIEIGEGIPKICVPIVEINKEDILKKAIEISEIHPDIVEWRGDFFQYINQWDEVNKILICLRDILRDTVILFTFRTFMEGGELKISKEEYTELNKNVINSKLVDLIDVELFLGEDLVKNIVMYSQKNGVKVIISNHDYNKTPRENEIVSRLCKMQSLGGDILKIAVMPQNQEDVILLLNATDKMVRNYGYRPVIAISMSDIGVTSRISGELFGSSVTFGSVGQGSAPGQICVNELKSILNILHGKK